MEIAIKIVSSALTVFTFKFMIEKYATFAHITYVAGIVSASCGIIADRLANFIILKLPQRIRFMRKVFDPRSRIEGVWVSRYDKPIDATAGVEQIYYDVSKDSYYSQGYAYNDSGKFIAGWTGKILDIDTATGTIRFWYRSRFEDDTLATEGFCEINYINAGASEYNNGIGYLVDKHTELSHLTFRTRRVTDPELTKLGKKWYQSLNESLFSKIAKLSE